MASIPVTIVGMDQNGPTTIVGLMSYSDREVGGGPIVPPVKPPIDIGAHPEHPIAPGGNVPAHPIELPHPEHPIALPPTDPPTNPPNPNWQWVAVPDGSGGLRWTPGYVPQAGDAQPH